MLKYCFLIIIHEMSISRKNQSRSAGGVKLCEQFCVAIRHLFPSEFFQMQCCIRTVKITLTNSAENEQVLHRIKEELKIMHKIKRKKAGRIGRLLRRNCLPKCVTERKIERRIGVVAREDGNISNCWMTLRQRKDIGNLRMKQQIALPRELALEEAMDCPKRDHGIHLHILDSHTRNATSRS